MSILPILKTPWHVKGKLKFYKIGLWSHWSRKLNDKLHIELNKTNDDKRLCESLWNKISELNSSRRQQIEKCIEYRTPLLQDLKSKQFDTSLPIDVQDAAAYEAHLRGKELGFLKSELQVELILEQNTKDLFKKKCPSYWYLL